MYMRTEQSMSICVTRYRHLLRDVQQQPGQNLVDILDFFLSTSGSVPALCSPELGNIVLAVAHLQRGVGVSRVRRRLSRASALGRNQGAKSA